MSWFVKVIFWMIYDRVKIDEHKVMGVDGNNTFNCYRFLKFNQIAVKELTVFKIKVSFTCKIFE